MAHELASGGARGGGSWFDRRVTYRDDRDADRARIAALEAELASARERIDELEGRRGQALVLARPGALTAAGPPRATAAERWLGAPLELAFDREFAGALPAERFEDVIERVREVTRDAGRSELLRNSMSWSASASARSTGPFTTIMVSVRDGKTRVQATDRLAQMVGALYGGIGGGIGGGAVVLPILAVTAMPVLAPLVFGAWFGGVYAGTRALFRRTARRRAVALQQVFDAACAEVERGLAAAAPP